MNQFLVEEMWKHTDLIEEENKKNISTTEFNIEIRKGNRKTPIHLPAQNFFKDPGTPLFMSFHREGANSMIHFHDFFEVIYVCKGTPIGVINNQEIPLQEGQLCVMNPNAIHYFKKYTENTDLILNIVLPKDLFEKSIFRILFHDAVLNAFFIRYRIENEKQPPFLYLQHKDPDIDHFIELLMKEYLNKTEYSHVIIESVLTLIFSFLLRDDKAKSSHGNSAMADIIDYIYLNYQTVSMQSVAAHFNYHPKYLSSLIHKELGQTFRELLVTIKLQNALNYLLYTDYKVDQIVEFIGYKDKSSFYNLFRNVYHMSPAQYRKKHR
jgi:AraC-type DNA-binding domain-containing proteins